MSVKTFPEILIRADGNAEIGFGHLMRALAFAIHASSLTKVKLLIRNPDELAKKACEKYGIHLQDISSVTEDEEAEYVGKQAGKDHIVFLDGYKFAESYQRTIKKHGSFLVCMDDHHERIFYADCVLNVSEISDSCKVLRSVDSRLLYGLKYALIRPEFSIEQKSIERRDEVFVCFGGGSETVPLIHKTMQALNRANLLKAKITIVLNEKLRTEIENRVNASFHNLVIQLRYNLSAEEMVELMMHSKMGICSSSTVALEARASGLPVVAGYFVENQKGIYWSLLNSKEIPVLGNLNEVESGFLASTISDLWDNLPFYSNSSLSYKNTQHTYHRLIHSWFAEMQFAIRAATPEDVELYLHWANQPDVRQSALNSEPILPENHRKWFASRLTSQSTKLYVGMVHNIPVAQLRFDLHDGFWEIDFSVDANYRNKGIGEILIRKGMKQLLEEVNSDCMVVGLVKPTNVASAEVFKKLHFALQINELRNGIELLRFHYALQPQLLSL